MMKYPLQLENGKACKVLDNFGKLVARCNFCHLITRSNAVVIFDPIDMSTCVGNYTI